MISPLVRSTALGNTVPCESHLLLGGRRVENLAPLTAHVIHRCWQCHASVGSLTSSIRPPVSQRKLSCKAAPVWNPQNVPDPVVMPSRELSPEAAVVVQLQALAHNDEPWPNHGLQTMYEFGEDIGGLDPSYYFNYRKDLYHFDHFMGQFQNAYPQLVNLREYRVLGVEQPSEEDAVVLVEAVPAGGGEGQRFTFRMRVKDIGRKKGCWMTKRLIKEQ